MDFEVYNFGKKVDVLTFEIELVNLDALLKLEAEVKVYPSPKTLQLIKIKELKRFYTKHAIPTASYKRFEDLKV
jgi:5-(carboxyamino)imidazole ribonucleotide synthase